jgi:hypothetical protein
MRREEEVGSGKKKNEEKVSRKEVGSMHLAKENNAKADLKTMNKSFCCGYFSGAEHRDIYRQVQSFQIQRCSAPKYINRYWLTSFFISP